jgi:putative ABC transport system substrate-binding protein
MRRRFVIALLVGIALAPLLSTGAAEPARMFHVGMVNLNLPRSVPFNVAFEQRLREFGYIEGQNLAIDFLGLDGHIERLPEAMEELVRRKVDVILAAGQEVVLKAAKQATGTIPIVMIAINYDPLALGYVGSLARPGGNITGVFLMQRADRQASRIAEADGPRHRPRDRVLGRLWSRPGRCCDDGGAEFAAADQIVRVA